MKGLTAKKLAAAILLSLPISFVAVYFFGAFLFAAAFVACAVVAAYYF